MAYGTYGTTDRGYDLSLFETEGSAARQTAPKKHQERVRKTKVVSVSEFQYEKAPRRKHNFAAVVTGVLVTAVVVLFMGVIIYGHAQVSELNNAIVAAQNQLEEKKSEYIQMSAKVEGSLSTAAVEEYARTQLGMTKATNQQKEYISLSQGDKVCVYEDCNKSVFTEIGDFFESLWS